MSRRDRNCCGCAKSKCSFSFACSKAEASSRQPPPRTGATISTTGWGVEESSSTREPPSGSGNRDHKRGGNRGRRNRRRRGGGLPNMEDIDPDAEIGAAKKTPLGKEIIFAEVIKKGQELTELATQLSIEDPDDCKLGRVGSQYFRGLTSRRGSHHGQ